jgi:hypothetical protein
MALGAANPRDIADSLAFHPWGETPDPADLVFAPTLAC